MYKKHSEMHPSRDLSLILLFGTSLNVGKLLLDRLEMLSANTLLCDMGVNDALKKKV